MLSATTFQGYKKCCMLAMDVWCFSKSTIRVDLEKHQTRLHYWGNSLCNFEESPLQLWGILLYNKQSLSESSGKWWPTKSNLTSSKRSGYQHHRFENGTHQGALLKLPFFTTKRSFLFPANLRLTFHSWSPFLSCKIQLHRKFICRI